jgi:predicted Na+-dependent transporter
MYPPTEGSPARPVRQVFLQSYTLSSSIDEEVVALCLEYLLARRPRTDERREGCLGACGGMPALGKGARLTALHSA